MRSGMQNSVSKFRPQHLISGTPELCPVSPFSQILNFLLYLYGNNNHGRGHKLFHKVVTEGSMSLGEVLDMEMYHYSLHLNWVTPW